MEEFFSSAISWILDGLYDYIKPFVQLFQLQGKNAYDVTNVIFRCWTTFLSWLLIYRTVYLVVGFFTTRKFKPTDKRFNYAILIPARNESSVIANTLESIRRQDYPADKITTFVIADNCTDNTAEIARNNGAIVYERFDDEHRTKGFALQFLFERIKEDYGIEAFDGYFIFDSDNLLKFDYVSRMNESFAAGEKIITSYRNTKNFDENWISASYAIHWLRSIRENHRARSVFKLATNIQGTGFLFANELVRDGWKYTSLTEDRAFTADAVVQGYGISYNNAAEFYDEQPVSLRIALRQRIRWAKGHILAFFESGWGLFKNMLFAKGCPERKMPALRQKFMSFDVFMLVAPRTLFGWFRRIFKGLVYFFVFMNVRKIHIPFLNFTITGPVATGLLAIWYMELSWRFTDYLSRITEAIYVFIVEHKRIKKMNFFKKVWYSIMWPWFDIIGAYSMYIALFMKVTWKPIPHESKINISDVEQGVGTVRPEQKEESNV